ncbi:MAG: 4-hydroxybenzoate polyprenyltransferase [Planctomycetota bacterium]|jgi:4-hydroxybenzoate polyprenyltransferase
MNPLHILRAMRPHQWVKNVFVLAAVVFGWANAPDISTNMDALYRTLLAFASFCLGSSAIYLVNDVLDIESDRKHPTKCNRPIAAGLVAIPVALATSVGCVIVSLSLGYFASTETGSVTAIVGLYMLLNTFYSLRLKHIVLVDVFSIASGFMLRVIAGGYASMTPVSHWLLLCTLFLSLFLALCKRQAEISLLGEDRGSHRKILTEYSSELLNQLVTIVAACTVLCYALYSVAEDGGLKYRDGGLVWTVPFVVFGLFRYLLLVNNHGVGGSPTRVLLGGDMSFLINGVLWLATMLLMLFGQI